VNGWIGRKGVAVLKRGEMKSSTLLRIILLAGCATMAVWFCWSSGAAEPAGEPAARIHYLGHAAFYLRFDNGISVLTDYGKSRAYGLNSPIFGIGLRTPDVATFSHRDEDHFGGPVGKGVPFILWGDRPLSLNGLDITPVRTFERTLAAPDNSGFLFARNGRRILHLGDCQALMAACDQPGAADRIRELYPDTYDVLLLPIGFTSDILEPAARFLGLLKARAVIPMHYWEPADKQSFLALLKDRQRPDGRRYVIRETEGPQWSLREAALPAEAVLVVSLAPASFDGWK
jgi:L-ascorbate metabolism protein UlaG (beta-lactamase superfamily)